jgi:succinate dehydrogenase/fumarate reductase flavoprotein subunit
MAYWARMSLWFSKWAIAVDRSGRRFVDEQMGDDILAQALVKQPGQRGALIWDDTTHVTRVAADYPSGRYDHDEVIRVGARTAKSDSLEGLAQQVSAWGIDPVALTQELRASSDRLRNAPFRAVATQPSITTPFGGIRIDTTTRVLNHDNQPVPGLYAAGADAGGVHSRRYIGGLVVALVLGRIAAETVFESTGTS